MQDGNQCARTRFVYGELCRADHALITRLCVRAVAQGGADGCHSWDSYVRARGKQFGLIHTSAHRRPGCVEHLRLLHACSAHSSRVMHAHSARS